MINTKMTNLGLGTFYSQTFNAKTRGMQISTMIRGAYILSKLHTLSSIGMTQL